jgi:hypothetical protein
MHDHSGGVTVQTMCVHVCALVLSMRACTHDHMKMPAAIIFTQPDTRHEGAPRQFSLAACIFCQPHRCLPTIPTCRHHTVKYLLGNPCSRHRCLPAGIRCLPLGPKRFAPMPASRHRGKEKGLAFIVAGTDACQQASDACHWDLTALHRCLPAGIVEKRKAWLSL